MDITTRKLKSTISNRGRYEIKLLTYGIILVFFFLYLISLNSISTESNKQLSIFLLSWSGILTFVYIMYTWFKITGQLFTPYIIFMLFFFLFNYGQPFMWAFGIHMPNEIGVAPIYPGHGVATDLDIVKTQIYVLMCAWMLHFGALLAVRNKKIKSSNEKKVLNQIDESTNKRTLGVIFKISVIFAIFSIPITLWGYFEDLIIAMTYGYRALYYSEHARRGATVIGFFSLWFFPSLTGLLIGSQFNRKIRVLVYSIITVFVFLNVAAGNRGPWLYKVIILIWLAHITYKPLTKKRAIRYLIFTFLSVYFLDAVVSLRNIGISFDSVMETFSIRNSSITKTFFEMGGSMNPTVYLQKYGWDFWPYGNTYLLAIGGLVMNRFLDLFGISYGIIGEYFRVHLGISWGPGFSIVAEPLMNFGPVFASLFMIVLGFLISKLFYFDNSLNIKNQPLRLLFLASSLEALIRINRNGIHVPIKHWFYGVVLFCFIIYVVREFYRSKAHNEF